MGADTIILVEVARAVSVETAEEYFRLCPHYVAGTFAVVMRQPNELLAYEPTEGP